MTPKERDEIEALLQEIEGQEMIRAPKNFKAQVLMKVNEEKKRRRQRRQMAFQFKVCVGMAAALLMLFTLNLDNTARQMTQFDAIEQSETTVESKKAKEQEKKQKVITAAQENANKSAQERAEKVKKQIEGEENKTFEIDWSNLLGGFEDEEKK